MRLIYDIGVKIQFPSEKEDSKIPFEFLGVVTDYNSVDIIQTPDYIKMSCKNYILRLLKSHGWDTPTPTAPPEEISHYQKMQFLLIRYLLLLQLLLSISYKYYNTMEFLFYLIQILMMMKASVV